MDIPYLQTVSVAIISHLWNHVHPDEWDKEAESYILLGKTHGRSEEEMAYVRSVTFKHLEEYKQNKRHSTEAQVQIFLENARLRAAIHGLCTLLRRNPPAALDTKKMPELEAILISLCQTTIEKLQPARGGPGDE